jgi:glutamine amidotransferase-like uncharacterized protein
MIKNGIMNRKVLLFFFTAFLLMSVFIIQSVEGKQINVVIYNGPGSIFNCVNNVESTINVYNSNHADNQINVLKRSSIKNINDLNDVDVLLMPGGTHGYIYFNYADGNVIRQFVSSGHGYIGICAGAYAGAYQVDDYYVTYGVAPHINCKSVYHEGLTRLTVTPEGSEVLGVSPGEYIIDHENGPVMYFNSQGAVSVATYDDISRVGYRGWTGIALDTYGSGKTILYGPHPESETRYPEMLGNSIKYVSYNNQELIDVHFDKNYYLNK